MNNTQRIRYSLTCVLVLFTFAHNTTALSNNTSINEAPVVDDLLSMSLTDLMNITISSVSKQDQALSDAAASVYVITQEAIHNAGALSVPEALRLAPTLQVIRITGSQYAISARGFNTAVSNKLLVLVDGRTVYTPLFSGVFWDHQDLLMEDIERIEVISGPGATLWGANAVNGVINIISRHSKDSHGALVSAHAGNFERGIRSHYGGHFGDIGHFRVYGKFSETDTNIRLNNTDPKDAFKNAQLGFRTDLNFEKGDLRVQGDVYDGGTEDRGSIGAFRLGPIDVAGNNILTRWNQPLGNDSSFQVQAYWDHMERHDRVLFQPKSDIIDIDAQYDKSIGRHRILLGGGYRYGKDQVDSGFFSTFVPDSKSLDWENVFIQDEFRWSPTVTATAGIKLEHNDYTGLEYLPNARLAWKYSPESLIWTALSRAVRAPSRYDREVFFPAPPNSFVVGGPNFESEVADVFELGYRSQKWDRLGFSLTGYIHDWDKLRSGTPLPVEFVNGIEGEVYGLEFWANYQVMPTWKISAGGTRLHKDLRFKPGNTDPVGIDNETLANDPKYHGQVRSTMDFSNSSVLEIGLYRMAELTNPNVPDYTLVDAHYHWSISSSFELSISGKNLLDEHHYEYGRADAASGFRRAGWIGVTWTP
jgi:iron complex outermembrane recepter protein